METKINNLVKKYSDYILNYDVPVLIKKNIPLPQKADFGPKFLIDKK